MQQNIGVEDFSAMIHLLLFRIIMMTMNASQGRAPKVTSFGTSLRRVVQQLKNPVFLSLFSKKS